MFGKNRELQVEKDLANGGKKNYLGVWNLTLSLRTGAFIAFGFTFPIDLNESERKKIRPKTFFFGFVTKNIPPQNRTFFRKHFFLSFFEFAQGFTLLVCFVIKAETKLKSDALCKTSSKQIIDDYCSGSINSPLNCKLTIFIAFSDFISKW